MLCPFCQSEMTEGFVQSARQVFFTAKPKNFLISPGKNDVPITGFWEPLGRAYHCEKCKKVICDYADTSWDQFG